MRSTDLVKNKTEVFRQSVVVPVARAEMVHVWRDAPFT